MNIKQHTCDSEVHPYYHADSFSFLIHHMSFQNIKNMTTPKTVCLQLCVHLLCTVIVAENQTPLIELCYGTHISRCPLLCTF